MTELPTIEEKAVELIEKFEQLATDIAPDAVELGMTTARVAAAQTLVTGGILAILAIAGWFIVFSKVLPWERGKVKCDFFYTSMASFVPGVISIATLVHLTDVWAWAGIFYPELWIAKQVLGW